MPYATPDDLTTRYDARLIAAHVLDDGSKENVGLLPTNPVVLALLSEASGDVNRAILQGKRYKVEDLEALTGDDRETLVGIVCLIAYLKIMRRRRYSAEDSKALFGEMTAEKDEVLKLLREGTEVFNLEPNKDAGVWKPSRFTRGNEQRRNYLSMQLMGRLYPYRRLYNNE